MNMHTCFIAMLLVLTPPATLLSQDVDTSYSDNCLVADAVWTNNINNYEYEKIYKNIFIGDQLFVWLKLKGGINSLEYIKTNKKLPVKLEWYTYFVSHFDIDSYKEISLTDEEIRGIEIEATNSESHYWNFRIWDYRDKRGYWKVIPRLTNGVQMLFDKNKNKCELEIIFK